MSTLSSVPEELERILKFNCPIGCDGKGSYPEQTADDEWEQGQCQWCFEYGMSARDAISDLINQQIKSVLDELEGEVIGGDESSGIFPEIGESSTIRDNLRAEQRDAIQKIRSRYE